MSACVEKLYKKKKNKTNILRGGLQSPNGGFQEGPLENTSLKHTINSLKIQK